MKHVFAAVLFLMIAGPALASGGEHAKDEDAIRAAWAGHVAGMNKHDAKAAAAFMSEDGDLMDPMGKMARGRVEIEMLLAEHFQSDMMKNGTGELTVTNVMFIKPDVAVVDGDATMSGMTGPEGKPMPPMKHHATGVMVKKSGKWWAQAIRVMMPPPPPVPAGQAPAKK
ncbi:MAG: SgcJ/EcaC family oxidoreductase [Nitrospirae bacterium]|nr:SgcJ/EcaC family oxidoreductase [Nitrospirota bacterium]